MFTEQEIIAAQEAWGNGIVKIGSLKNDTVAAARAAEEHLDRLYAFDLGQVLFKPTKCAQVQFRLDKVSALSYFVGGNSAFAEDKGFAINPWTAVRFHNAAIILEENRAIAMGNYWFTDPDGTETKVEYTFGYKKDAAGNIKIDLHHSSLPFSG
jgi:hypothetical protein